MPSRTNNKVMIVWVLSVVTLAFYLSGCATLGAVGSGLFQGLVTLIKIPLEMLHVLADILNKLPKPPPGVFPG